MAKITPTRVLVDTGPIVAMASERDAHHRICVEQFARIRDTLCTSWGVIVEAAWILRRNEAAVDMLIGFLVDEKLVCLELDSAFAPWFQSFRRKYKNLLPQVADASLVYLVQREEISAVFTLDRRDFQVYASDPTLRFNLLPAEI